MAAAIRCRTHRRCDVVTPRTTPRFVPAPPMPKLLPTLRIPRDTHVESALMAGNTLTKPWPSHWPRGRIFAPPPNKSASANGPQRDVTVTQFFEWISKQARPPRRTCLFLSPLPTWPSLSENRIRATIEISETARSHVSPRLGSQQAPRGETVLPVSHVADALRDSKSARIQHVADSLRDSKTSQCPGSRAFRRTSHKNGHTPASNRAVVPGSGTTLNLPNSPELANRLIRA